MNIYEEILDTWDRNNGVNVYLLEHLQEEWLSTKINGKGRSIGEQFVHINNIRSFWISKVSEKIDLKVDKKQAKNKAALIEALQQSAAKMKETLAQLFEQGSIKGYKPHPTAFFAQMIAHEAHHRGQVMATVARNELPINKSVNFGLWGWNTK